MARNFEVSFVSKDRKKPISLVSGVRGYQFQGIHHSCHSLNLKGSQQEISLPSPVFSLGHQKERERKRERTSYWEGRKSACIPSLTINLNVLFYIFKRFMYPGNVILVAEIFIKNRHSQDSNPQSKAREAVAPTSRSRRPTNKPKKKF